MKIALYGKEFSEDFHDNIVTMFSQFYEFETEVVVHHRFKKILELAGFKEYNFLEVFSDETGVPDGVEVLISMGGDGTFLETLKLVREKEIPVLGINTGRLGFLANISKEDMKDSVESLLKGDFSTETRGLLKLVTSDPELINFNIALNEITIHKKGNPMISIDTFLEGVFLNSYWADGLIISTPTGSTAYSMAVGGPIMLPLSQNFIISPVSPHNLTVRPIVVPDNMEIGFKVNSRSDKFNLSLDSRSYIMDTSVRLSIKKAESGIRMVKFQQNNFYQTLRNKLMWGMDRRN